MSNTLVPDAITNLIAVFGAAVGTDIVFDGPQVTGAVPAVAVLVGYDGDDEGDYEAVSGWEQTWQGMQSGQQVRAERFDIVCCVIAFAGDTDVATRRASASSTFAALNAALRDPANRTLGLPFPASTAEFSSGSMRQPQTGRGLEVRIPFSVHVETRV